MKLWHVAQWGNKEEGPNGWDTQCIVRANNMEYAITQAELHFRNHSDYRNGEADVIYLMGDDGSTDNDPKLIITMWIHPAYNLGKYPAWYRHPETDEWVDHKTHFGE